MKIDITISNNGVRDRFFFCKPVDKPKLVYQPKPINVLATGIEIYVSLVYLRLVVILIILT